MSETNNMTSDHITPRTVCVVGGGPTGLTVARELERAGHRAIVLEANAGIGGKADSVEIDGRAYDLGGHLITTRYERVAQMITELGLDTEDTTPHRVYDLRHDTWAPQSSAFFQREPFQRYAALREAHFPRIAEPGLAHSARALAQPVSEWLRDQGLATLAQSLGTGYTAAGYGYLDGDLPALYFVKYAEMTGLLWNKPELLGHTGSFTITGGFKRLWQEVADGLNDVRCGVTITSIERDPDRAAGGVSVHTTAGTVVADDLVLTLPADQMLPLLDATPDERDLAGRVRVMDYYTTIVTAAGLPRSGFYLVEEYTAATAERGRPVSFHHRYDDRDEYVFYSYGAEGLDGDDITAKLRQTIEDVGGEMGTVHTQRRWAFMPYFGSQDIADGAYERIDEIQGRHHTYWAGSLPAYELVECNVGYSQELVRQFFSPPGAREAGQGPVTLRQPAEATAASNGGPAESVAPSQAEAGAAGQGLPTIDELRAWLVEQIAAELEVEEDEVSPDARLDSFTLESISVAALLAALSDWLGFTVPPTLLLEQPTIEAVARYLAEGGDQAAGAAVVGSRDQASTLLLGLTAARPFFCIGGALGAAYYLLPLARLVGSARPFYGVRAPGYDGLEEPLDTVPALAARYVEAIRLVQPYGPYLLGGHSFGGVVAYEMGRQLREAGEEVTRIVLLDAYVPVPGQPLPPADDTDAIEELLTMNRLAFTSGGPAGAEIDPSLSPSEQKERLGRFLGATGSLPVEDHIGNMLRVYQANLEANVKYQPLPSDLKLTLTKATGGFPPVMKPHRNTALKLDHAANGWEDVEAGELTVVEIPGDHFTMFAEPNDQVLASVVRACMADEGHAANALVGTPGGGTPAEATVQFNPLDPAFLNDPYPFYRALRETVPIHYEEMVGGWLFTRYDDVSALLRDPRVIRPPVADYLFASVPQATRDELSVFEEMLGKALPFSNPPDHTRLRDVFRRAFTPRAVEAMRPGIQQTTGELLDAIEAKGGVDYMTEVAYPLPSTVVMDFVGVPRADQPQLTGWATQVMTILGAQYATDAEAIARNANAAMQEYAAYMTDLIEQRRKSPREDMLSTLIDATGPEGSLTDEELILNVMSLLNAGLETTANYIGNGTLALLRHPDQFRLLREDPSVAETAAEELLRYDGPAPILTPQLASEDLEVGGQPIKKGQLLYPVVGAANRDPARFPDPERLDLTRPSGGQLSFGSGIHFCIGAALARVEGQILFASLAARFPHLRLDPSAPPPTFREDPLLRGLVSLHVRTDPA